MFSIIIPCYNSSKTIIQTLDSLNAQLYKNFEVIIVDDGSVDDTIKTIEDYKEQNPQLKILLINQSNKGAPAARNLGMKYAKGEKLIFLDSDDLISPNSLLSHKSELSNTVVTFTNFRYLYSDGKIGNQMVSLEMASDPIFAQIKLYLSCIHSFAFPKCILKNISWDESLAADQDGHFLFQVMFKGVPFRFIPNGCAFYRIGQRGISTKRSNKTFKSRVTVANNIYTNLVEKEYEKKYFSALATRLDLIARDYFLSFPKESKELILKAQTLDPNYIMLGHKYYLLARRILGFELATKIRHISLAVKSKIFK